MSAALALLVWAALAAAPPAPWSQSRADAQGSAYALLDAPKSARARAWTFEGTGRVYSYQPGMTVWSPPALAVVGGRAVLAVGGYDRFIWMLDAATGEPLWKYATGDGVYATPVFWHGGEAEAAPLLLAASNDREVYALDAATGERRWSTALQDWRPTLGGARLSAPALGKTGERDAAFVGAWVYDRSLGESLQRATLSALDARTGEVLWTAPLGDNALTAPVYAVVGGRGRLFIGSGDGNLHALDADTGAPLWKHTEHDGIAGAPAVAELQGGALVLIGSRYGEARALDAQSGAERWRLKTADRITGSLAVAQVGGRLLAFVPSYDRRLYAVDARTGAVAWRYAARAGFYSSPAVLPGPAPLVVASAWDHALHGVDAATGEARFSWHTGAPLWDVAGLDSSTWSSPVLARLNGEEVAFAGGYDGRLRAFLLGAPPAADTGRRNRLTFWLSFPAVLAPLCGLALWLSRRKRYHTI